MTDIGTGFLQAVSGFLATKLGASAVTTWKDSGSLIGSLHDGIPDNTKPAFTRLKADITAAKAIVEPIIKAIDKQTTVIGAMASAAVADAKIEPFTAELAGRVATRIGTALIAVDEAVNIIAKELVKDLPEPVRDQTRVQLMGIWNPWVEPFRDLADGAGKVVDSLGSTILGVDQATRKLGDLAKDHQLAFDQNTFKVSIQLVGVGERDFGAMRLSETKLEMFFGFARRQFLNPSETDKLSLVERDGTWWRADSANFGLRVWSTIKPGLQNDPLLKKVMPGSSDPKAITPTAVSLDTTDGFYLGDGRGAKNEKAVIPVTFNSPVVELREVALGILRNAAAEVTGLEVTTVIAAKLGDAVGLQIGGAGVIIALDGSPTPAAMFPWDVSPRWPDAIGLRVKAGPIKGGGYLERKIRTYGTAPNTRELAEFGGVIQLEILKAGVYAIGILTPEPFSLVLVMGVRFPTAIELSFGFTFNGVGGILAINRTINTSELIAGMASHFIDKVLFPDDPVAEAPGILDKVAKVFPPADGGFVVGPIIELGWGSQAKIVEAKIGLVIALPDPKMILLGSVRVRAPSKEAPLTDLRCEVYGEISADRLLLIASLRDSKIAGITVSGDLGLLIQWGGGGAFALSVGGFNPRYTDVPTEFRGLQRITIDLSPPSVVKIIVKAYFAVTAGAIMAGVRGDLSADLGVASAKAWLGLDMIFYWVPTFGFAVDLQVGIAIKVFGMSFAEISFTGSLEGTHPWRVQGVATVDVWFLPTFHFDLGPIEWGDAALAPAPSADPLDLLAQALSEKDSWKAVLPADGDQLATLSRVADELGLLAHPLAALEVTQSRLPLETHIDRIGSAGVIAHRVAMGVATTSAGPAAAVSTVRAPFAPGQFLTLTGDQLLARSGFDDLPSGCRIAAATTPVAGPAVADDVRWHTYFRDEQLPARTGDRLDLTLFAPALIDHGLANRVLAQRDNPYLRRTEQVTRAAVPPVAVLPAGSAVLRRVDDGAPVLGDLGIGGVLTASAAAWVADTVNAAGVARLTSVAVGAM